MSFRDKAQIVVVSVAIALALAAGFLYVTGRITSPTGPSVGSGTTGGTDDQPIIMAGGSLYIGTGSTAEFKPNGDYLYYTKNYQVFGIDVMYQDDKEEKPDVHREKGEGRIEVVYCRVNNMGACINPNQKDIVKMTFDNRVTTTNPEPVIKIENSLKAPNGTTRIPISKAPRMLLNLRSHMRKGWKFREVTAVITDHSGITPVTKTWGPYVCHVPQNPPQDDESECEVVVHTCTPMTC